MDINEFRKEFEKVKKENVNLETPAVYIETADGSKFRATTYILHIFENDEVDVTFEHNSIGGYEESTVSLNEIVDVY
jgi:hypothetical protein